VKAGRLDFEELVKMGCLEYLDVNEMNNCSIAVYEKEIKDDTTHLEVDFAAAVNFTF
jgi:DNA-directed RNA polymerase III subunit RPC2